MIKGDIGWVNERRSLFLNKFGFKQILSNKLYIVIVLSKYDNEYYIFIPKLNNFYYTPFVLPISQK